MASHQQPQPPHGLLQFAAPQQTFDMGGVRVGGQPGARATALVGSIFYHGHDIHTNEDRGEFDEEKAARLIRQQDEWAERTGNPCLVDVVGGTPDAIRRHLEFAASVTDAPLLIDGTTADVRLAGLAYAAENGLVHRCVYNSIQPDAADSELAAIKEAGLEQAILLTYYLKDFTARGRVQAVRELLPRVREAGVCRLIVDTCVLDLATMGQACSAMHDIKQEFGLPVGGGVHNAVSMWKGLKTKMGPQAATPCTAASFAMAVTVGADFVLYGPIEDAPHAFPSVAMVDAVLSQLVIEQGSRPEKNHPRYRIG